MGIVIRSFEFESGKENWIQSPRQVLPSIAFVLSIFRLFLIALNFHEILPRDRYQPPLKFRPGNRFSRFISILAVEFIQFPTTPLSPDS